MVQTTLSTWEFVPWLCALPDICLPQITAQKLQENTEQHTYYCAGISYQEIIVNFIDHETKGNKKQKHLLD